MALSWMQFEIQDWNHFTIPEWDFFPIYLNIEAFIDATNPVPSLNALLGQDIVANGTLIVPGLQLDMSAIFGTDIFISAQIVSVTPVMASSVLHLVLLAALKEIVVDVEVHPYEHTVLAEVHPYEYIGFVTT
jgi:hypothetical protein